MLQANSPGSKATPRSSRLYGQTLPIGAWDNDDEDPPRLGPAGMAITNLIRNMLKAYYSLCNRAPSSWKHTILSPKSHDVNVWRRQAGL